MRSKKANKMQMVMKIMYRGIVYTQGHPRHDSPVRIDLRLYIAAKQWVTFRKDSTTIRDGLIKGKDANFERELILNSGLRINMPMVSRHPTLEDVSEVEERNRVRENVFV